MNQRPESTAGPVAASPAQRGIWFTERAGGALSAFHLALAIEFTGPLDVTALRTAIAALVDRHPILATAATERGGELVLVPAATRPELACLDGDPSWHGAVDTPFDLRHGPLVRFVLATAGPGHHTLLVVAHHLIFDGVSKEILVAELAAGYTAAAGTDADTTGAAGADGAGAGSAVGYAALARAQREWERAQAGAAEDFWRRHWREPADVVLPGLLRTPAAVEPGAAFEFTIDDELAQVVGGTATALGVTRFELLLAAVHLLLRRYGNPDGVVAVDVSSRSPAARRAIGCYVNEMPVPPPALDRPTGRGYVQAVRATLRRAYPVRAVPVSQVVPGLRPRAALAPVSLSYRAQPAEDPGFAGLAARVRWLVPTRAARNTLQIQVVDREVSLAVSLQYSPTAIAPDAVGRIAGHLRHALAALAGGPDAPVDRLAIIGPDERRQVTVSWNDTGRRYPEETVVSLFRGRARAHPDRTALIADGRRWTYRELDTAADRLAGTLRGRGIGPSDLVGVCLGRTAQLPVALLGIALAGAAYVPVDPAYPQARRRLILADAAPAVILDGEVPDSATAAVQDPPPGGPVHPDDPAYVIYTSGSTGRPKGVRVPHRALANLLLAMRDELGSGDGDVWLAHTSLSFDISALEIFLPLVTGGTVVLASTSQAAGAAGLLPLIREHHVTHVQATPSAWRMLLDGGFGSAPDERRSVVALSGGEALPVALARELRGRVRRLFNLYGPTETTIWSTLAELPEPVDEVTIGRPIPNTRVYVCDESLEPVPIGIPGDLYLGGAGLATGYHGRPELTGARFVADPFGEPGGRLYRTGDRASWLPDGRLCFHGRTDNQVKIRGHRIELGEVESALLEHPAAAAAAVAVHPDLGGQPALVGYLVPRPGAPRPEPAELRALLGAVLPAAAVPTRWVPLHRLPTTPNGKLDRAALPPPPAPDPAELPGAASPAGEADGAAPEGESPIVARLRPMWCEALELPDVDLHDDLFDLGGHSLTVIQLMDRILAELDVEVPLDAFYDRPTVAAIAAVVERLRGSERGTEQEVAI